MFFVLGNNLFNGLGGDIIHYDLQGRPYTTKINGVSEGAWLVTFLGFLFIVAKTLAVAFTLEIINNRVQFFRRSLYLDKYPVHSFSELLSERTSGSDIGSFLLAAISLTAVILYKITNYILISQGSIHNTIIFWILNSCDAMTVSAFLFSFFTLRKNIKSTIAFCVTFIAAILTNEYAIQKSWHWFTSMISNAGNISLSWIINSIQSSRYIPLYILVLIITSFILFAAGTLKKNDRVMPYVCLILTILFYIYYKLLYGYDWLSLEAAYKTGVMAGPVTMIWFTYQFRKKINMNFKTRR